MTSEVRSLDGKTRLLSPKSRSAEPFQGQLVVLDNPKAVSLQKIVKSPDAEKKVKRPSSGNLEVLKTGKDSTVLLANTGPKDSHKRKTSSERRVKELPGVKRKEECSCQGETICKKCIQQKMQDLSINSNQTRKSDIRIQQSKAEKFPVGKISLRPDSSNMDNANVDEGDNTSSSEESDNDEGNGGSGSHPQNVSSTGTAKAPLELLGKFLSALMKKEYKDAQKLCHEILKIEPENSTCLEFKGTLEEKLQQDDEDSSSETDEESSDEEDGDSSESLDDDSDEESSPEDDEEQESEEEIDISSLNLLMGGVPIRK